MKTLINLIGLTGFGSLTLGVYVTFGTGAACMQGGAMALAFALVAMAKQKGG